MDHPKKQISHVIHLLAEGTPNQQQEALETYFLPNAGFTHPLCRIPRFSNISVPLIGQISSRWVIWMIYRWYRILSPRIVLSVDCDEYNQKSHILFVEISQVFSLFFVPFYKSHVHLTTKLVLESSPTDGKLYIASQEDLYQLNEVVKFFWPGGATIIWFWQMFTTGMCILGALIGWPVTVWQQRVREREGAVNGVGGKRAD